MNERRADYGIVGEIKTSVLELNKKIDKHHEKVISSINEIKIDMGKMETIQNIAQENIQSCRHYRNDNEQEKKQTQSKLTAAITKLDTVTKLLSVIGMAIIGIIGRIIYKLFDK